MSARAIQMSLAVVCYFWVGGGGQRRLRLQKRRALLFAITGGRRLIAITRTGGAPCFMSHFHPTRADDPPHVPPADSPNHRLQPSRLPFEFLSDVRPLKIFTAKTARVLPLRRGPPRTYRRNALTAAANVTSGFLWPKTPFSPALTPPPRLSRWFAANKIRLPILGPLLQSRCAPGCPASLRSCVSKTAPRCA